MKKFIFNISVFCFYFILIFIVLYFKTPNTNFVKSYISAQLDKDQSLKNDTSVSRIIIIGGSNATFGVNSEMLSKELSINVINYSLHAGFGLNFILNKTEDYIKSGDIIILIPEYQHFFDDYYFGEEILARYLVNGNIKDLNCFSINQMNYQFLNILRMLTHKIQLFDKDNNHIIYSRRNFNKYGDFIGHLNLITDKEKKIMSQNMNNSKLNNNSFKKIKSYSKFLIKNSATLYISYPSIQHETYLKNLNQINKIHRTLLNSDLILIDEPVEYTFADSLLYDSPYHLNWKGREIRTKNLITNLKKIMK